ncbi:MAG TPA: YciI family protein [Burkholderiaceae bacterium]|jgi:uncharacterized protein YciI|nr:YciI family protein [Burkholderiaceae bacterium]
MLFAIRFTDKPSMLDVRKRFLPAHIEWLDQRQDTILVAGSLRANVDANPVGALWIVEADDEAQVEAVFQTDPFWVNGLRAGVEIMLWSKAFPLRKVEV